MSLSKPRDRWLRLALFGEYLKVVVAETGKDSGDEFSNNLISDLAPLLTLFGEQFAKQYMSHSLTVFDSVIFAMAPLGIITVMVGAIRTAGPSKLRALIGRARENDAAAEVEYMSSVSHEVCEVWNGHSIVRIPGSPEIQLFVYIDDLDERRQNQRMPAQQNGPEETQQNPDCGKLQPPGVEPVSTTYPEMNGRPEVHETFKRKSWTFGLYTITGGLEERGPLHCQDFGSNVSLKQSSNRASDLVSQLFNRHKRSLLSPLISSDKRDIEFASDAENGAIANPRGVPPHFTVTGSGPALEDASGMSTRNQKSPYNLIDQPDKLASNITINLARNRMHKLYIGAAVGVVAQSLVIVFCGLTTYHPAWQGQFLKAGAPVKGYAYPLTSIGTCLLVVGVFICASVIEKSTQEHEWTRCDIDEIAEGSYSSVDQSASKGGTLRLLWLQREVTVNDQKFGSYALIARNSLRTILTSHPLRIFTRTLEEDSPQSFQGSPTPDAVTSGFLPPAHQKTEVSRRHVATSRFNSALGFSTTRTEVAIDGTTTVPRTFTREERIMHWWTVIGTTTSLIGFFCQFVGLRAMHWSASLLQLGATVFMLLIRVWVRSNLTVQPKHAKLMKGHELDWLAKQMYEATDFWRGDTGALDTDEQVVPSGVLERPKEEFLWRVHTAGGYLECASELFSTDPAYATPSRPPTATNDLIRNKPQKITVPSLPEDKAQIITEIRQRVGRLCRWTGSTSTLAMNLASAIEQVLNANKVFDFKKMRYIRWSIPADVGNRLNTTVETQRIYFTAYRDQASDDYPWQACAAEIEAVLSLWVSYAHQQISVAEKKLRQAEIRDSHRKHSSNSDWLRGSKRQAVEEVKGYQLLGPCTPQVCRDLAWWVGNAAREVKKVSFRKKSSAPIRDNKTEPTSNPTKDNKTEPMDRRTVNDGIEWTMQSEEGMDTTTRRSKIRRYKIVGFVGDSNLSSDEINSSEKHVRSMPDFLSSDVSAPSLPDYAETECLALSSVSPLEDLYARHIFSAFIWAVAEHADLQGTTRTHDEDGSIHRTQGGDSWPGLRVENDSLTSLAQDLNSMNVGRSVDDVLSILVPPLSSNGKLLAAPHVVEFARKTAAECIQNSDSANWDTAGNIYSSLCAVCETFGESNRFAIKAQALASAFYLAVSEREQRSVDFSRTPEAEKMKDIRERLQKHIDNTSKVVSRIIWALHKLQDTDGNTLAALYPASRLRKNAVVNDRAHDIPESADENLDYKEILRSSSKLLGWGRLHRAAADIGEVKAAAAQSRTILPENTNAAPAEIVCADFLERTPLHYAAMTGRWSAMSRLFRESFENAFLKCDIFGWAPIHYYSWSESTKIRSDVEQIPTDVLHLLLENKFEKNIPDPLGKTPLLLACGRGNRALVERLLDAGADQELRTLYGSVFHLAARAQDLPTIKMLVKKFRRSRTVRAKDGTTPLHECARIGDPDVLQAILEDDLPDLDAKDGEQNTALHIACRLGRKEIARILSKHEKKLAEVLNDEGMGPMHVAVKSGHLEVLKVLIENKVSLSTKDRLCRSPLHLAVLNLQEDEAESTAGVAPISMEARLNILKCLIDNNAPLDDGDQMGRTPLHYAAMVGAVQAIKDIVLKSGTTTKKRHDSYKDYDENTPLHLAAAEGHLEAVQYLAKSRKPEVLDSYRGESEKALHPPEPRDALLEVARPREHERDAELSEVSGIDSQSQDYKPLTSQNKFGQTPLHSAACRGQLEVVKFMIEKVSGTEQSDKFGDTALHLAASNGQLEVFELLVKSSELEREDGQSINSGNLAALDSKNLSGRTPIHSAASHGKTPIVDYILTRIPEAVDGRDKEGLSPLFLAICAGHCETAERLIQAGAPVNGLYGGITLFHKAAEKADVDALKLLKRKGASINAFNDDGIAAIHQVSSTDNVTVLRYLLSEGADINLQTNDGRENTPLHTAIQARLIEMVRAILEWEPIDARHVKADINKSRANGNTPLYDAAYREDISMVRLLLQHKADPDKQNRYRYTPLLRAIWDSKDDIVTALLNAGATFDKRDEDGWSPLYSAIAYNRQAVVKTLLTCGAHPSDSAVEEHETILQFAYRRSDTSVPIRDILSQRWEATLPTESIARASAVNSQGYEKRTLLHYAVKQNDISFVKTLLRLGAESSRGDAHGKTALHIAAREGFLDITKELLGSWRVGDNIDATTTRLSMTALHYATQKQFPEIAFALLKKNASVSIKDANGKLPLDGLLQRPYGDRLGGSIPLVEELLSKHSETNPNVELSSGTSLLHIAIEFGCKIDLIRELLEKGARVDATNGDGKNVLCVALQSTAIEKNFEIARTILDELDDSQLDKLDESNSTALFYAASKGYQPVVAELLRRGANPNLGRTPLRGAIEGVYVEIVEMLLRNEPPAAVDTVEPHWTPLIYAAYVGSRVMTRLLLDSGANVNQRANDGMTAVFMAVQERSHSVLDELLGVDGIDVNIPLQDGRQRALHKAVATGRLATVKALLLHGADVNSRQDDGTTAVSIACGLPDRTILELLIDHEADVNISQTDGTTPLHEAARNGQVEAVAILLKKSANWAATVSTASWNGYTPLEFAAGSEHELEIVKLLLGASKGATLYERLSRGWTPLYYSTVHGEPAAMDLILKYPRAVATKVVWNSYRKFPLERAISKSSKEKIHLLLKPRYSIDGDVSEYQLESAFSRHVLSIILPAGTPSPMTASELDEIFTKFSLNMESLATDNPVTQTLRMGSPDVFKYLFEERGDLINLIDHETGLTMLHLAAYSGHLECVRYLLEQRRCPYMASPYYATPLQFAVLVRSKQVVDYLAPLDELFDKEDEHGWTTRACVNWLEDDDFKTLFRKKLLDPSPSPLPENMFRSPKSLSTTHISRFIELDDKCLEAVLNLRETSEDCMYSAQANHPIPLNGNNFYFEVTIIKGAPNLSDTVWCLAVGLSNLFSNTDELPGWGKNTWGFHSDDGNFYHSGGGMPGTANFGKPGIIVGCGLHGSRLYYTLNGRFALYAPYDDVKGKLFPTIGLRGDGLRVRMNFEGPFAWDTSKLDSSQNLEEEPAKSTFAALLKELSSAFDKDVGAFYYLAAEANATHERLAKNLEEVLWKYIQSGPDQGGLSDMTLGIGAEKALLAASAKNGKAREALELAFERIREASQNTVLSAGAHIDSDTPGAM